MVLPEQDGFLRFFYKYSPCLVIDVDDAEFSKLEFHEILEKMRTMYDESPTERSEYFKEQCRGGYNFAKTIELVVDRTNDAQILKSVYETLDSIADCPRAGSVAWEMRRFIRYAPPHMIAKFSELIKELAETHADNPDGFRLDMDFYYWDVNWVDFDAESNYLEARSQDELDRLRRVIESYRRKYSGSEESG